MKGKQYIFFDLGWTLEDETEAQVDRAKKAVLASKGVVGQNASLAISGHTCSSGKTRYNTFYGLDSESISRV